MRFTIGNVHVYNVRNTLQTSDNPINNCSKAPFICSYKIPLDICEAKEENTTIRHI